MKNFLFLTAFLLLACSKLNEYDYEKAGEEYCVCMKKMGAPQKYLIAADSCDRKIARKYYWFRFLMYKKRKQYEAASQSHLDSAVSFMNGFDAYTNKNCCKETLICDSSMTGVIIRLPEQ